MQCVVYSVRLKTINVVKSLIGLLFFFFQAEEGIRDVAVTGVQTWCSSDLTLVGLDLVSVPQMMIARPLVAGPIAGAMLGDVATGLQLGVLFELFQYDILPMGATRYPESGPATVAAVSAAHAATGTLGLGLGALVGRITGMVGGLSLHGLRQLNTRAVRRAAAALEAGDPRVLERVHAAGILRDAVRAAVVTALGLVLAQVARAYLAGALPPHGVALLNVAAVGAALAAGAGGAPPPPGPGPPPCLLPARGLGGPGRAGVSLGSSPL